MELGGKSPCIIDSDVDLQLAARRVAWGRFVNAGQTCVAPDYILVVEHLQEKFAKALQKSVTEFYGEDPKKSPDFARIVNVRHFHRIKKMVLLKNLRYVILFHYIVF